MSGNERLITLGCLNRSFKQEDSSSNEGKPPGQNSQGPPTPPTTPGEIKNFRVSKNSPSYLPHTTATNFDIGDFPEEIIRQGALMDNSELDQYLPEQSYVLQQQQPWCVFYCFDILPGQTEKRLYVLYFRCRAESEKNQVLRYQSF